MHLPVTTTNYLFFLVAICILVVLERLLLTRESRSPKQTFFRCLLCCVGWVLAACGFAAWLNNSFGHEPALMFLTGYVVELALSMDNLFVFVVIFSFFAVPPKAQGRALTYGIVGAIIMRAAFIWLGTTLLHQFEWIMYLLGALLIYTAIKLIKEDMDTRVHPDQNILYRVFSRIIPSTKHYVDDHFVTKVDGKWLVTPLFFVVLVIESTDLVFAVDSIPAIFGITQDPFIVFTSNIFAVIGLRALYTVVSEALMRLRFLKYGLAMVLGYIGLEMVFSWFIKPPIELSLGIVMGVLAITGLLSKLFPATE